MSRGELARALARVVADPQLDPRVSRMLGLEPPPTAADHTELFTFQLHPYASTQLGPEGQLGGVARDRIAGFFRALEVSPPSEPDHLAVLLDAYAQLLDLGDGGRARHARTVLLHEHLLTWVPRWNLRVRELGTPAYRRWADLVDELLRAEAAALDVPEVLPAALRDAPDLEEVLDGEVDVVLGALLAPVRSGLVLARADLARAARELGLGLRIGERAYALRALLSQDVPATLTWLAGEARRQAQPLDEGDRIAAHWQHRLIATAVLLDRAAAERDVPVAG